MKRILNGILASTLLLSTLGISFAQENSQTTTFTQENTEVLQEIQQETLTSGKCGDNAYWSFDSSSGTFHITGTGAMYDYNGDFPWSSYSFQIETVNISEGITHIGECSFFLSPSITTVNIPSSVTSIGRSAFYSCDSLNLILPNSVTSIGSDALGRTATETLNIPSSMTYIESRHFWQMYALTSLTIPNTITSIAAEAFEGCNSLQTLTIPASVTSIGDLAFANCSGLNSVFVPSSVTEVGQGAFICVGQGHEWPIEGLTIYGYSGSAIESWCKTYDVRFVAVDANNLPSWVDTSVLTTAPSTPTYNISTSTSSNGSVKLNQTTAESGERVTLSVTPNSGYMIDSVLVKDASGNSITCGYDWVDGVYAFLMPSGNVSVTANFSKIPETTYTPTITTSGNGNTTLSSTKPSAGDKVQITVSPSTGYVISSVTVKDSSGNDVLCVKVSDGLYQYTQPSGNVTIHVTYYFAQTVVESYSDINYADWYAAYASYAIENGLMNGTSVGYFDPYIPVSRGMVAVILASASGESIPTANGNQFTDVEAGLWYSNAIEWCKSKNIVAGYEDGRFGVNDAITREQMVTILRGFANYMGYDSNIYFPERLSAYTDSTQVASYARDPFSWALGLNYIQGTGNQIKPQDNATRAEFANLLNYFMESN